MSAEKQISGVAGLKIHELYPVIYGIEAPQRRIQIGAAQNHGIFGIIAQHTQQGKALRIIGYALYLHPAIIVVYGEVDYLHIAGEIGLVGDGNEFFR